ncbi:MAG: CHAD domain-containing protein [Candidatus Omnitrophota bacterium]
MSDKTFDFLLAPIRPGDPIELAGRKVVAGLFKGMEEREEGTKKGENIEDLHRMRVFIRRMRVCLRTFKPVYGNEYVQSMTSGLKQIADLLGEVRDIDVFVDFLRNCESAMPKDIVPAAEILIETRLAMREKGLKKIQTELDGSAFQQWKDRFREQLAKGSPTVSDRRNVHSSLPEMILSAYGVVLSYRNRVDGAPSSTLHELRICNKRFRYLCESFQDCFDERMAAIVKDLKQLQDLLGDIQDKNRDIQSIENNISELTAGAKNRKKEDSLKSLLQLVKKKETKARRAFFAFWKKFALEENEDRLRYIIRHAMKSEKLSPKQP